MKPRDAFDAAVTRLLVEAERQATSDSERAMVRFAIATRRNRDGEGQMQQLS